MAFCNVLGEDYFLNLCDIMAILRDNSGRIRRRIRSSVICSFTCQCFAALYVSQIARLLPIQVSSDVGISGFNGKNVLILHRL